MLILVAAERPISPPPQESYYGYQVTRRLSTPPEIPQAPQPDVFGRMPATPRQIAEVIYRPGPPRK